MDRLDVWLLEQLRAKEGFFQASCLLVRNCLWISSILCSTRAVCTPSHGDGLTVRRVVVGGGVIGGTNVAAAYGTLGAHLGPVAFKVQDLHSELFIFGFQLCESFDKGVRLLLSLLTGDSGALAVLDEAVLILWEDAAHQDETLDGHCIEVDLEETNPKGLLVDLFDVLVFLAKKIIRDY